MMQVKELRSVAKETAFLVPLIYLETLVSYTPISRPSGPLITIHIGLSDPVFSSAERVLRSCSSEGELSLRSRSNVAMCCPICCRTCWIASMRGHKEVVSNRIRKQEKTDQNSKAEPYRYPSQTSVCCSLGCSEPRSDLLSIRGMG